MARFLSHFTEGKEYLMGKKAGCCSTHLIEGDGTFNASGLDNFIKQVKLKECGVSYVVVSIMGPQSGGKSTLLNHLFDTDFREMNAENGRTQTTNGIWMARWAGIEPCTIVMDLEGNDGAERGPDDTAFEKQIALFALAVSDIVLINMWSKDIGRDHAANKPLLRTIFQEMLRLFSPRKTTLMFVVRDVSKTPIEILEGTLRRGIEEIWDSIKKSDAHKETQLSEIFNVQVVGLSSYEEKEKEFLEQVASLRQKFIEPGGLAGDRRGVVPASGFSVSAQRIWKVIKEHKDLQLPAHTVMVANIRCEEIFNEIYSGFLANKKWRKLKKQVQSHDVPDFGKTLSPLLHNCLSSYDEEAAHFEESVRSEKRKHLEEKLNQLVQPAYQKMLEHITNANLKSFKSILADALNEGQGFALAARDCTQTFTTIFDEQCQDAVFDQAHCDSTKARDTFSGYLDSHIAEVQTAKLSELTTLYKSKLDEALSGPVEVLLRIGGDDTWSIIRTLLHDETETAVSQFPFSDFEMDKQVMEDMISELKKYAIERVEVKARAEANNILYHMKERFIVMFNHDNDLKPHVWTEGKDIQSITKTANASCLKLLSVLAAIRLDEDNDTVGDILLATLGDPKSTYNPLASNTWENVPATKTLITPVGCTSVWKQLQKETGYIIAHAIAYQEQDARNNRLAQERHDLDKRIAEQEERNNRLAEEQLDLKKRMSEQQDDVNNRLAQEQIDLTKRMAEQEERNKRIAEEQLDLNKRIAEEQERSNRLAQENIELQKSLAEERRNRNNPTVGKAFVTLFKTMGRAIQLWNNE